MASNLEQRHHEDRLTIRDIARLAGVSVTTVSRVVNDRPDVAADTRDEVLRVMHRYGFAKQRPVHTHPTGRTRLIGFALPVGAETYVMRILAGAAETLLELDQHLVLYPTRGGQPGEPTLSDRLSGGLTDGAVIVLPEESGGELSLLARRGYPFVVADPRLPLGEGIPVVSAAHLAGALAATEHLLALGHRRVGLITGTPGWVATRERVEGYRTALAAAGIAFSPELVAGGDFTAATGYEATRLLLGFRPRPTAIFASNDNLAVGALRAALECGLRVPTDLSIVGVDDTGLAASVWPGLTTVRQPLAELGRTAVSLLNRLVEGQTVEALRVELATRLVERDSTAPAPPRIVSVTPRGRSSAGAPVETPANPPG